MIGNDRLTGFDISGHAMFAESGSDIVCASVSSAAYMAANTVTAVILNPRDSALRERTVSSSLQATSL